MYWQIDKQSKLLQFSVDLSDLGISRIFPTIPMVPEKAKHDVRMERQKDR